MEKFLAIETSRAPRLSSHPAEWESNEPSGKVFRGGGGVGAKAVSYHSGSRVKSQTLSDL